MTVMKIHMKFVYFGFQLRAVPMRLARPVVVVQVRDHSLAHQEGLPKLPVPPLRQTCERYLAALEPLVSEEEMDHTRQLMAEFLSSGGVGERLQKGLERRARKTENWVYKVADCVRVARLDKIILSKLSFKKPSVVFLAQWHLVLRNYYYYYYYYSNQI